MRAQLTKFIGTPIGANLDPGAPPTRVWLQEVSDEGVTLDAPSPGVTLYVPWASILFLIEPKRGHEATASNHRVPAVLVLKQNAHVVTNVSGGGSRTSFFAFWGIET